MRAVAYITHMTNTNRPALLSFDLLGLMRQGHITIGALAAHMDVAQSRIRAIRNGQPISLLAREDYARAIFFLVASR